MRNPHSLQTAIELLGPLVVVSIIFTLHFTKFGVGVVMIFFSVYLLRKGGAGAMKLSPDGINMKGSFACLMLIGGFVLVVIGGNDLRTEFPQAVAQELKKQLPHDATNTPRPPPFK